MQQFNIHNHFGKLDIFPENSDLIKNVAYLARAWINYPYSNKLSLYMENIFSEFNCSNDPLVNEF